MNIPENAHMPCPVRKCDHQEPVSIVDPSASFSELWLHVRACTGYDQDKTSTLMTQVKLMDEDGNEVRA
ncbi:hypothetical protein [Nonomuraea sp. NPDC050786]|uniref:hypothetical protein n=1 Tax=Nonomuraea sp. NPDC050786 TaxID=3154840 RepID=UPI0034012DE3